MTTNNEGVLEMTTTNNKLQQQLDLIRSRLESIGNDLVKLQNTCTALYKDVNTLALNLSLTAPDTLLGQNISAEWKEQLDISDEFWEEYAVEITENEFYQFVSRGLPPPKFAMVRYSRKLFVFDYTDVGGDWYCIMLPSDWHLTSGGWEFTEKVNYFRVVAPL